MKGGGHPPLHAPTSHPVSGTSPASRLQDEGRGSSLGRNVQPPTSESSAHPPFPALSSLARPPSHVSEEPSDIDTDNEATSSSSPVQRSSSVKLTPSGAGLLPPPPPNPRLSPWKDIGRVKGHARSVSHGGVTFTRTGSNRERERNKTDDQGGGTLSGPGAGLSGGQPPGSGADGQFKMPLTSALKRPGHRRVFSESLNTDKTLIPGILKTIRLYF